MFWFLEFKIFTLKEQKLASLWTRQSKNKKNRRQKKVTNMVQNIAILDIFLGIKSQKTYKNQVFFILLEYL